MPMPGPVRLPEAVSLAVPTRIEERIERQADVALPSPVFETTAVPAPQLVSLPDAASASDPDTQAYIEPRVKGGRSKREAIRMLNRFIVDSASALAVSRQGKETEHARCGKCQVQRRKCFSLHHDWSPID